MKKRWLTYTVLFIASGLFLSVGAPSYTQQKEREIAQDYSWVSKQRAEKLGCLSCHEGIEPTNPKMAFIDNIGGPGRGCTVCHKGNATATKKDDSHKGMYKNPADLRVVDGTCGKCHSDKLDKEKLLVVKTTAGAKGETDHIGRMKKALMATLAGEISSTRYLNAAQDTKNAIYGLRAVKDEDGNVPVEKGAVRELKELPPATNSMADNMLRNACARCHLWTYGIPPAKGNYRNSGCAACHMTFNDNGVYRGGDPSLGKREYNPPFVLGYSERHEITKQIPTGQCMRCHNNGGDRIGLSFTGRVFAMGSALPFSKDGETQEPTWGINTFRVKPDIHYERGLDCVECHSSKDLHGDGNIYGKKEHQNMIRCETCHGTPDKYATLKDERGEKLWNVERVAVKDLPETIYFQGKKLSRAELEKGIKEKKLPGSLAEGVVLLLEKNSVGVFANPKARDVIRTFDKVVDPTPEKWAYHLVTQIKDVKDQKRIPASMMLPGHMEGKKSKGLECYACHAARAPQCYGCHFKQDKRGTQLLDFAKGVAPREGQPPSPSKGAWTPGLVYSRWEEPPLGLDHRGKVAPYVPGCQVFYTEVDDGGKVTKLNTPIKTASGLYGLAMNPSLNPHSIRRDPEYVRSCESCHNDPKALGLGSGYFAPEAQGWPIDFPLDRLVDDEGRQIQETSRYAARPFNKEEIEYIRRIKANQNVCLHCHKDMAGATVEEYSEFWKKVRSKYKEAKTIEDHDKIVNTVLKDAMRKKK
jgi:hypothetical protein